MNSISENDTDILLTQAASGDRRAAMVLLDRYRGRLRNLIATRLDRRLSARVDPSDVIQETLVDANDQLLRFAKERPLPFYPWLRQVALSRLAQIHRFHLRTQQRTVGREAEQVAVLDQSAVHLAERLCSKDRTPSEISRRNEELQQLQAGIATLSDADREVLVLRYIEQLSTKQAAEVLGISPNNFAQKHLRAVRRLKSIVAGGN